MITIEKILKGWLDIKEKQFIEKYISSGRKASGDWAKSLEQFFSNDKRKIRLGILANDYSEYMVNGRRPNQKKTHKELVAFAAWSVNAWSDRWVKNKGLNLNPFGVAYNIGKFGIKVPNEYNDGKLTSDVIDDNAFEELNRKISLFYVESLKSDIRNAFE